MKNFISEYKKCLGCVVLLIFLIVLQMTTGQDTTAWVSTVLDGLTTLMLGGAIKYSVLKTSERNVLKEALPPDVTLTKTNQLDGKN